MQLGSSCIPERVNEKGTTQMEKCSCAGPCATVSKCDIFDFMAKHVGMTVIHPGGFAATRQLIKALGISRDSRVIDIACGIYYFRK